MHLATKLVTAAVLATLCATAPVFALAGDPTGTWQTTGGESRYKVTYCGDGTQLCAKLTWLRSDARTQENLPYLNHYVVQGAVHSTADKWQGQVHYAGDTFAGSLTMTSNDTMKLSGCKGMFCKTMNFSRI